MGNRGERHGSQDISSLMNGLLGDSLTSNLSDTQRAIRAWFSSNGKKEETHTCGVWLKEASGKETLPSLVVYIDSNVIMQDFSTNKEIYKFRLEKAGFPVADVQFRLSKWKKEQRKPTLREEDEKIRVKQLSEEENSEIIAMTSGIESEELRKSVYEAMVSSKQWENAKKTNKKQTSR